MAGASGKKLDDTYKLAWLRGLKTTYYLRTLAATSAEKSTGRGGELNAVPVSGGMAATGMGAMSATGASGGNNANAFGASSYAGDGAAEGAKFCAIDDPECEACQ